MGEIILICNQDNSITIFLKLKNKTVRLHRKLDEPIQQLRSRLALRISDKSNHQQAVPRQWLGVSETTLPAEKIDIRFLDCEGAEIPNQDDCTVGEIVVKAHQLRVENEKYSFVRHTESPILKNLKQSYRCFVKTPLILGCVASDNFWKEYELIWYAIPELKSQPSLEAIKNATNEPGFYDDFDLILSDDFRRATNVPVLLVDEKDEAKSLVVRVRSRQCASFCCLALVCQRVEPIVEEPKWLLDRWAAFPPPPSEAFRVHCWNLLAPCYAMPKLGEVGAFPGRSSDVLSIKYRRSLLAREILKANADINCFQECSTDVFVDLVQPLAGFLGHSARLAIKLSQAGEGVCTTFNRKKFTLLEENEIFLAKALRSDERLQALRETIESEWSEDYLFGLTTTMTAVSLFTVLKYASNPLRLLIVINSHFYWHPAADHIRVLQGCITMELLSKLCEGLEATGIYENIDVCYCGDLNSDVTSGCIHFLKNGSITASHPAWATAPSVQPANMTSNTMTKGHGLDLEFGPCHPQLTTHNSPGYNPLLEFTNFNNNFSEIVDWIFTNPSLEVVGCLPGVISESLRSEQSPSVTGLPDTTFPSDHIPVCVDLRCLQ